MYQMSERTGDGMYRMREDIMLGCVVVEKLEFYTADMNHTACYMYNINFHYLSVSICVHMGHSH